MSVKIRQAMPADAGVIMDLVRELAEYENEAEHVMLTTKKMEYDLQQKDPNVQAFLAEKNSKVVGMLLYTYTYSTRKGKTLYIDDFVVGKAYRRQGIGKLLFDYMMLHAYQHDVQRIWRQVLKWNESAQSFYDHYKPETSEGSIDCKIHRTQIEERNNK